MEKGNLNAVNVNSLKIRHKVIDAQTKELTSINS